MRDQSRHWAMMQEAIARGAFWQDQPYYVLSRCELSCGHVFCHRRRTRYVYGLYDARNGDVFYVGSTFYLMDRFIDHCREHPYVAQMLSRGVFPIPLLFCSFPTWCDQFSRLVEREITTQLRRMGHSAYGDDNWREKRGGFQNMVEEQAAQVEILKEMYRRETHEPGMRVEGQS